MMGLLLLALVLAVGGLGMIGQMEG